MFWGTFYHINYCLLKYKIEIQTKEWRDFFLCLLVEKDKMEGWKVQNGDGPITPSKQQAKGRRHAPEGYAVKAWACTGGVTSIGSLTKTLHALSPGSCLREWSQPWRKITFLWGTWVWTKQDFSARWARFKFQFCYTHTLRPDTSC